MACAALGVVVGLLWWRAGIPLGPLATVAGAVFAVCAPLRWRWRVCLATAVLVRGTCATALLAPSPGAAGPLVGPEPADAVGRVIGPVRRDAHHLRFRIQLRRGGELDVVASGVRPRAERVMVRPCDRVRVRGRRGRELRARANEMAVEPMPCAGGTWVWRLADDVHTYLRRIIGDGRGPGLVRAMVLGDRSGVDDADENAFRAAGVAHVLSVSGMHLAVITVLILAAMRRVVALLWPARAAGRWAALVAAMSAICFALITGARVATVRSAVMSVAVLVPIAAGLRVRAVTALCMATAVMLAVSPELAVDLEFQLSIAATTVLVVLAARARASPGRSPWWIEAGRASLATALVTAPIAGAHFGTVAPIGLVANLMVVPVVEIVVVPAGFAGSALVRLWEGGARVCFAVAAAGARVSAALAAAFAHAPLLSWPGGWAASAAALCAAVAVAWRRGRARHVAMAAAVSLAVVAAIAPAPRPPRDTLVVTFVDVGQGDAAIVQWPAGSVWLIDTGPWSGRKTAPIVAALRDRGIDAIDRVVITHPHPDHQAALPAVAESFPIRSRWTTAEPTAPRLGHYHLDGADLWVLAPLYDGADAVADPVLSTNDNSLVILIEYGGRRLLFTGDIEAEAEARLLRAYPELPPVDVVKVPHHGSRTSSTPALVSRLHPRVAVISAGEGNRFGHPHREVVERWRAAGAAVLVTAKNGSVRVLLGPRGGVRVEPDR